MTLDITADQTMMQDAAASVRAPAAGPAPVRARGDLVDLLAAFQFLQAQNARMATALSARLGVGAPDLRVLFYLGRMPDSTPKDVAAQLQQASGSVTALLDRLEVSGHLVRQAHPTDRRSITLRLTDSGEGIVRAVRGSYRDAFDGIFTDEQLAMAADVLRTLGIALGPVTEALGAE